ncbi:hypothetical protein C4D60_Mb09t19430 [Musa balbisiana]|uniref:Uncharacterized protein n=1 Tax=Musa balbisiana TaxID=52838 RepID=A0A4S8IHJ2_MUSBA|nr:hypothetical protein C4D60_Mb09t19430 [Musa balbisiana]
MGNCQASDSAAAVIQHPDGRLETAYWPLSASQVMASNPGHYVAVITTVTHSSSSSSSSTSSSDCRSSSRGGSGGGGNSVASEEGGAQEEVVCTSGSDSETSNRVSRHGHWRPTLQTIAEAGSFKY